MCIQTISRLIIQTTPQKKSNLNKHLHIQNIKTKQSIQLISYTSFSQVQPEVLPLRPDLLAFAAFTKTSLKYCSEHGPTPISPKAFSALV